MKYIKKFNSIKFIIFIILKTLFSLQETSFFLLFKLLCFCFGGYIHLKYFLILLTSISSYLSLSSCSSSYLLLYIFLTFEKSSLFSDFTSNSKCTTLWDIARGIRINNINKRTFILL